MTLPDPPPTAPDHSPTICPSATSPHVVAVREILGRVGDKWSLMIVANLRHGPVRFNELKRRIQGVSQRMLTLSLKGLERDGIVIRTVTPTVPPRVDYALTPLGISLLAPVFALTTWVEGARPAIEAARAQFDLNRDGAHDDIATPTKTTKTTTPKTTTSPPRQAMTTSRSAAAVQLTSG